MFSKIWNKSQLWIFLAYLSLPVFYCYSQAPIVLINEDFTDGKFDDVGAGIRGANYAMGGSFSSGTGFHKTNDRSEVTTALSRRIHNASGGAWGGVVQWGIYNNPNRRLNTDLKKFYIDKYQDVVVVKYGAFADVADGQEIVHAQITLMNWNEDFAGHPHYWHDISIEADQYFQARGEPVRQLAGNVNVVRNNNAPGISNTHYEGNNGYARENDLNDIYRNLVTWRYVPELDKTNVELWGHNNQADYFLDVGLHNRKDNESFKKKERYAVVDHVQFTFFRPVDETVIKRSFVDWEDVQVGFTYAIVGITKKSDFNLDFKIDERDAKILDENWEYQSSATIREGDANNDEQVNMDDVPALLAYWSDSTTYAEADFSLNEESELIASISNVNYLEIRNTGEVSNLSFPDTSEMNIDHYKWDEDGVSFYSLSDWNFAGKNIGKLFGNAVSDSNFMFNINFKGSGREAGYVVQANQKFIYQTLNLCPGYTSEIVLNAPDSLQYNWDLPLSVRGESNKNTISVTPGDRFEESQITVSGVNQKDETIVKGHVLARKAAAPVIANLQLPDSTEVDSIVELKVSQSENIDYFLWTLPDNVILMEGDSTSVVKVMVTDFLPVVVIEVTGINSCGNTMALKDTVFIKKAVGQEPLSQVSCKIYPNPVEGIMNILLDQTVLQLEIIDMAGKVHLMKEFHHPDRQIRLDISTIPSGNYLLRIKTPTSFHTKKFVVNHK